MLPTGVVASSEPKSAYIPPFHVLISRYDRGDAWNRASGSDVSDEVLKQDDSRALDKVHIFHR